MKNKILNIIKIFVSILLLTSCTKSSYEDINYKEYKYLIVLSNNVLSSKFGKLVYVDNDNIASFERVLNIKGLNVITSYKDEIYFIPYGYNTILKTNTKGNMDAHILQEYDGLKGKNIYNAVRGSEGLITLFNLGYGGNQYDNQYYWYAINYTYKGVNKMFHLNGFLYGICEKDGKLYVGYDIDIDRNGYISIIDMESNRIIESYKTYGIELYVGDSHSWNDQFLQSDNCILVASSHMEFKEGENGEDGRFYLSSTVTSFNTNTKEFKKFHFPVAGEVMQEDAPQLSYVHNNQLHVITREDYHYIFDEDLNVLNVNNVSDTINILNTYGFTTSSYIGDDEIYISRTLVNEETLDEQTFICILDKDNFNIIKIDEIKDINSEGYDFLRFYVIE